MNNYIKELIYDGSFEGLLTSIFYAYPQKERTQITRSTDYVPNMLNSIKHIDTEIDKFKRVYNSILNNLSDTILQNIYIIYLSETKESGNLVLDYLKLCYKYGISINLAKNNDTIIQVDKLIKRVYLEAERFRQFVRFKEITPLNFYAKIEPEYNILPLIIDHFTERFSDQNFIIHDTTREIAIIYDKKSSCIIPLLREKSKEILKLNADSTFEDLFKIFYNATTIKERLNIKCRNNYMPKRYHKNLTELI